ncbi:MAG TPA: SemiSWEET family transporter [Oligoflexia bacterium]|nr:SemiSWEET family transporter [Oligoflexia bacterium]
MFLYVLASLAACSIWLVYAGLAAQWCKVWKNNVPPGIPIYFLIIWFGIHSGYSLWGLAKSPPDWFMFAAFVPGVLLFPVIGLQFKSPRPKLGSIAVCAAGVLVVLAFCAGGVQLCNAQMKSNERLIGAVVSGISLLNLAVAIPGQIRKVKRTGINGSSRIFVIVNFLGFAAWLAYGLALPDPYLITTQTIGVLLQGYVVALHFR